MGSTVGIGDGIAGGDTRDSVDRVLDHLAILDVKAADLRKRAGGGVVTCDELGDDGEFLSRAKAK